MARLDEYYFISAVDQRVFLPKDGDEMRIVGRCYERKGFNDGQIIVTSAVNRIENGVAYTRSGTKYVLQNKHKDLMDLERAVAEGVFILEDWQLTAANGKTVLSGFSNGVYDRGVVTSQEGNFVVLDKTRKYFVIWPNTYPMFKSMVEFFEHMIDSGIPYPERFDNAWHNSNIKPIIFGEK